MDIVDAIIRMKDDADLRNMIDPVNEELSEDELLEILSEHAEKREAFEELWFGHLEA